MERKKCAKRNEEEDDPFKQLPVTVLTLILSFLPFKEAAATSILSKFWKRIWLFSDALDLDASKLSKHHPGMPLSATPEHVPEHVKWISNVLQSHRDAGVENPFELKKLQIHTQFNTYLQIQLDEWISYASKCRVRSLELDFTFGCHPKYLFFQQCCFAAETTLITSLRSLSLIAVNITGEGVHSLLRNCPFLETLIVRRSEVLGSVEICGPSLALKHLEVCYCRCSSLDVRDTSLVSLTVIWVVTLRVRNNPKLVAKHAADFRRDSGLYSLGFCFNILEVLTFSTYFPCVNKPFGQIRCLFPFSMNVMKKLTLMVDPLLQDSAICAYNLLLCHAPMLEKFVLEFIYHAHRKTWECTKRTGDVSKWHPRFRGVKVLEVGGYYGQPKEDEILEFILQHYVAPPEKVIFHLNDSGREMYEPASRVRGERSEDQQLRSKDERVEWIRRVVPSTTELIIV